MYTTKSVEIHSLETPKWGGGYLSSKIQPICALMSRLYDSTKQRNWPPPLVYIMQAFCSVVDLFNRPLTFSIQGAKTVPVKAAEISVHIKLRYVALNSVSFG